MTKCQPHLQFGIFLLAIAAIFGYLAEIAKKKMGRTIQQTNIDMEDLLCRVYPFVNGWYIYKWWDFFIAMACGMLCEFAEFLFSAVFEMKFDSPSYFTGGVLARVIHQWVFVGKLTFLFEGWYKPKIKGQLYIFIYTQIFCICVRIFIHNVYDINYTLRCHRFLQRDDPLTAPGETWSWKQLFPVLKPRHLGCLPQISKKYPAGSKLTYPLPTAFLSRWWSELSVGIWTDSHGRYS